MLDLFLQAIDLKEFMKAFDMPDTFFSWFLVTELHVWLLGARLMQVHWRVGWLYCRDPFCSVLPDLLVSSTLNSLVGGGCWKDGKEQHGGSSMDRL